MNALLLAAPILLAGLVIGLVVSIMQTITQIQEQTLTFVPKIAGMILVAIAMIPWIVSRVVEFAQDMFAGNF
ncbi:MAG: flagellar biosynthetic protein FliQ [Planctomycetes bacterium]|nr:flagellar biosynthetic protein FliQ [Planctomycetota bacterium]NOG53577.1 flagellar biosynthetic protein FliQ [Planctomycetota bacterium]